MSTYQITKEVPTFNEDGTRKYEKRASDGRNEPVSDWRAFGVFVGTFDEANKHIEALQAQGGSFAATLTKK